MTQSDDRSARLDDDRRHASYSPHIAATRPDVTPMPEMPELVPLEGYPPYLFSCSAEEQHEYLLECAVPDQDEGVSRTYLAYLHGMVVGFLTMTTGVIALDAGAAAGTPLATRGLPAVHLAHLAVDDQWEGRGIGRALVVAAVALALEVRERTGCRYLTIEARTPALVAWLEAQQFTVTDPDAAAPPVGMHLDLARFAADLEATPEETDADD